MTYICLWQRTFFTRGQSSNITSYTTRVVKKESKTITNTIKPRTCKSKTRPPSSTKQKKPHSFTHFLFLYAKDRFIFEFLSFINQTLHHHFPAKKKNKMTYHRCRSPSMAKLHYKVARVVSRHDHLKLSFQHLKTQIKIGLLEVQ